MDALLDVSPRPALPIEPLLLARAAANLASSAIQQKLQFSTSRSRPTVTFRRTRTRTSARLYKRSWTPPSVPWEQARRLEHCALRPSPSTVGSPHSPSPLPSPLSLPGVAGSAETSSTIAPAELVAPSYPVAAPRRKSGPKRPRAPPHPPAESLSKRGSVRFRLLREPPTSRWSWSLLTPRLRSKQLHWLCNSLFFRMDA